MNNLAVDIGSTFLGPNVSKFDNINDVPTFVTLILRTSFAVAGLILLFYFIMGGIGMIGSAGKNDPKALEQSKQTITSALIGFVVVFLAYWIVQLLGNILKIQNLI